MKKSYQRIQALLVFCAFKAALSVCASDWPQFLGPSRNGVYAGGDLAAAWPKDGPPVLWRQAVGQGFSGPAVTKGKVILFHRVENKEVIECLEATTGKVIWTNGYPTMYRDDFGFDEGPRATPSISDERVYTFGAEGVLSCFDLATGTNVWTVNAKKDFHAAKGFFGIACSPLVDGNAVFMNVGGKNGLGIVAFDKTNGKVLWKATDDEASYSSPVAATFNGRRTILFLTRSELIGTDPAGSIFFRFPFEPPIHSSVTAATPLVVDDRIFLSASYGTGAVLLKVNAGVAGVEKLWSGDDILSSHYATSVHHNGFLYGLDGRTDPGMATPTLRCVEVKSGKVRWKKDFEAATITFAGDELLLLTERGELIRAKASPDGFDPKERAQILSNQVRAHPALADGRFYARSKNMMVCVNLGAAPKN